jgi:hypothetical protein
MIAIFFVPGMFGSTIEYVARSYSNELTPIDGKILDDGSMHSFKKIAHIISMAGIDDFFKSNSSAEVLTPIYPFKTHHLPDILTQFNQCASDSVASVLIHANSTRSAELNILFQYHKIAIGLDLGLDIFCNDNNHSIIQWNSNYTHWSQMEIWQLREWFSLFYVQWVQEWIDSKNQVDSRFLSIDNADFLSNPVHNIDKIFAHCKITQTTGITDFFTQWQKAQQYIVDEFNLLDRIVEHTITNQSLEWQSINVIAEAIVQQRLRAKGYEIRCDGLDKFPTDAIMFNTLLEKVQK